MLLNLATNVSNLSTSVCLLLIIHVFATFFHFPVSSAAFSCTSTLSLTHSKISDPLQFLLSLSLSLAPCPPPSLLIRAICWKRRQRNLTIDIIVLNAVCVCVCVCVRGNSSVQICSQNAASVLEFASDERAGTRVTSGTCGPGFVTPLPARTPRLLRVSPISPSLLSLCHLHISIFLTPLFSPPLCFPLVAVIVHTFFFPSFLVAPSKSGAVQCICIVLPTFNLCV